MLTIVPFLLLAIRAATAEVGFERTDDGFILSTSSVENSFLNGLDAIVSVHC